MHMADALISPAVGATLWAGSVAVGGYASRKLAARIDERLIPLMGVVGAFIFAAQMINFTIPGTGSSGHLGGGLLLAILLGPHAAFLTLASVLTVQALFFADGGLLALGCNIWNLGFYPCYLVYPLLYRPLAAGGSRPGRLLFASLLGVAVALQLGAFSVVLETLLSGRSELPFGAFALLMQPIHLAIGLVEGFVTAGIVGYVATVRPDMLAGAAAGHPAAAPMPLRRILVFFAALAILGGGLLSWFASPHPDGLEWAIARVTGQAGLAAPEQGVAVVLKGIQERTAFLPDYGFKPAAEPDRTPAPAWPGIEAGTSAAGVTGAAIVLGLIGLVGMAIRLLRARNP